VLAAIFSFRATPIYEATVRLAVEADTPQIRSINDLYQQSYTDEAFIGTQIQALQSDNLALRTIEQLGLAGNPAFAPSRDHRSSLPSGSPAVSMDVLLGSFQGNLRVEPVRDSHVVKVTFRSTNPELAAKVANALAYNLIEYNVRPRSPIAPTRTCIRFSF
jgi:polysaccharide biosynthesis transport protein